MKHFLIDEAREYALILRGVNMTEYAVVSGLDKEDGSWDYTCCYYDFGELSDLTRAQALFKATDHFLALTDEKHISFDRMGEIATTLKDGLIEDDEEEAYRYMADTVELSDAEAEYLGLDMTKLNNEEDDDSEEYTCPSSMEGDYSPSNPWDAPGMSVADFF